MPAKAATSLQVHSRSKERSDDCTSHRQGITKRDCLQWHWAEWSWLTARYRRQRLHDEYAGSHACRCELRGAAPRGHCRASCKRRSSVWRLVILCRGPASSQVSEMVTSVGRPLDQLAVARRNPAWCSFALFSLERGPPKLCCRLTGLIGVLQAGGRPNSSCGRDPAQILRQVRDNKTH